MQQRGGLIGIVLGLAALTFWLYVPALHNDFVNYDDTAYVTQNPHVQSGLTPSSVEWAFTSFDTGNWHPLTWLSHELDVQLYGLKPAGHHLTNVILHVANTLLLFVLLWRTTGAQWCSALVAAFFAWHPLHVESVAWVSERKDVLSAFFGLLAILAYVSYAKKPRVKGSGLSPVYLAALICFALSLMAKGMLVTLPFLLLLLDFWPLRRIADCGLQIPDSKGKIAGNALPLKQLILEKVPFFVIAGIGICMTFVAQQVGGNIWRGTPLPISMRVMTALYAYFRYLERTFLPTHLAVFYPYLAAWPRSILLMSAVLLVAVSVNVFRRRATHPYLIVGWLWFLGTLVPVIGLVQVGYQSMADRYTYIPSIGLLIMVIWDVDDLTKSWRKRALVLALPIAAAACACWVLTRAQEATWKNSETLFRQALKVTADNYISRTGLGLALSEQGRTDEAIEEFKAAVKIAPKYFYAELGMGTGFLKEHKWAEAAEHLRNALEGFDQSAEAHAKLGEALAKLGQSDEAAQQLETSLRIDPGFPLALNQLAWLRATDRDPKLRDGTEAAHLAERAVKNGDQETKMSGVLDAAYAELGLFQQAIAAAGEARKMALSQGKNDEAATAEKRLDQYRAGHAFTNDNNQAASPAR